MMRVLSKETKVYVTKDIWWYIYIIDVDNRGQNNRRFWNRDRIYYPGISDSIGRRLGDYLFKRGNGFINTKWRNARIIPVYIGYFYGNEFAAMKLEKKIKKYSRERKEKLINSDQNKLVGYKPCKHIIVKKVDGEEVLNIY